MPGPDPVQLRRLQRKARLLADGKYECDGCGKVDDIDKAVVTSIRRSPIVAVCPPCLQRGDVIIGIEGDKIRVRFEGRSNVVLASRIPNGAQLPSIVSANPKRKAL